MEQTMIPDTHSFVKEMAEAGMPEPVAEAFVKNYTKYLLGNLATKADIANVQHEIELLRKDTKALVVETKSDLIKWIVGTMLGTILSLAGLGFALAAFLRP